MTGEQKEQIVNMLGEGNVFFGEPMKKHTTFRIGGNAEIYAQVDNTSELAELSCFCRKESIPFFFLGKGSNVLVSDKGITGVVATFKDTLSDISCNGELVVAEAGASLSALASYALSKSLTGLEFAAGIPGSVGGALYMNAGAYGGEMAQIVEWVRVLTPDGEIKTLTKEEMHFGYRTSVLKEIPYIALACGLELMQGDAENIKATMADFSARRREKQPLEYPSAGSTFKRPEGFFAGKLIEEAGLRGRRIGGAMISEKHCGFIVNEGSATAEDVKSLIEFTRKTVYERFGVLLEPEIIFVGD